MKWRRGALAVIVVLTLVRIGITTGTGLSDTEAYYVSWARWPSLSYYDHPPLVAWLTWLVPKEATPVGWRFVTVVCTAVFALLVNELATRMFSARAGFFATVLVSVLPAFMMTSVLVNPEALLAPLWIAALIALYDLREHDEWWRPLWLGSLVGVGFLAKYTAVLVVPLGIGWLATSPETRRWLRRPSLYAAGLVALALATPVIVWNATRGFPTVRLHFVERAATFSLAVYSHNAVHTVTSQLALFHPLVFPCLAATAVLVVMRARDPRYRFLAWAGVPTLLFFLAMMVRVRDAEPHWPMVAYVPLAIAMAGMLDASAHRRLAHGYIGTLATVTMVGLGLYCVHIASPVLLERIPAADYDANADPVNETLGWDRVHEAIRRAADGLGPRAVVVSNHNVLCGHIEVELDDSPPVYCKSAHRTEYDFVGRGEPPSDAPIVYVESARYSLDPATAVGRPCSLGERVDVERAGRTVQSVRVWSCDVPRAEDIRQARR